MRKHSVEEIENLEFFVPGRGGWGDPLEPDPACVLRDVLNELVSLESARDDYGVVIDAATLAVDEPATARRRSELRSARAAGRRRASSADD